MLMTAKNKQSLTNYEIDITVQDQKWEKAFPDFEKTILNTAPLALNKGFEYLEISPKNPIEISIVLAGDFFIQDLNKQYRDKDKPTNVLSFPQTTAKELDEQTPPIFSLGDIILAFETIEKEALEQNKTFQNHLQHLIIHGCLHLLHFDHIEDDEAEIMERLEITILNDLGIKNPYQIPQD